MATKIPKNARYGQISGLTKREAQVQLRLVSSALGSPLQVKLTQDEYDAVRVAAREHVQSGAMSTFIRELGVAAAAYLHEEAASQPADLQKKWVVEKAAEDCACLPGEFLRMVVLESIGYTKLCEVTTAAKRVLESRELWARDED
jgi:hypothetical protein